MNNISNDLDFGVTFWVSESISTSSLGPSNSSGLGKRNINVMPRNLLTTAGEVSMKGGCWTSKRDSAVLNCSTSSSHLTCGCSSSQFGVSHSASQRMCLERSRGSEASTEDLERHHNHAIATNFVHVIFDDNCFVQFVSVFNESGANVPVKMFARL